MTFIIHNCGFKDLEEDGWGYIGRIQAKKQDVTTALGEPGYSSPCYSWWLMEWKTKFFVVRSEDRQTLVFGKEAHLRSDQKIMGALIRAFAEEEEKRKRRLRKLQKGGKWLSQFKGKKRQCEFKLNCYKDQL